MLERDRHVEGCWTAYSPSLERTLLKKLKYLGEGAATVEPVAVQESSSRPTAAAPPPRPDVPQLQPAAPPQATAAPPPPRPAANSGSVFADKLREAFGKDS